MRHRDALRVGGAHELDRNEYGMPRPTRRHQSPPALAPELEEIFGIRVVDVADERGATDLRRCLVRGGRLPPVDRTPTAERANEVGDVPGQALARRAEARAAPALDPTVAVHEAGQQLEARIARGVQIDLRNEGVLASKVPESQSSERGHQRMRDGAGDAGAWRRRRLDDSPVVAAGGMQREFRTDSLAQALQQL